MSDRAFDAFEDWRRRKEELTPSGVVPPDAGIVTIDEVHFAITPTTDPGVRSFFLHLSRDELCRSCVEMRGNLIAKWRLMVNARRMNRDAPAAEFQADYKRLRASLEAHYRTVEHVCAIHKLNEKERKQFRAMARGCALMQGPKQEPIDDGIPF